MPDHDDLKFLIDALEEIKQWNDSCARCSGRKKEASGCHYCGSGSPHSYTIAEKALGKYRKLKQNERD